MQYLARLASAANLTTALTELASKYNRVRNDFVWYSADIENMGITIKQPKIRNPHFAISYYVLAEEI